MMRACLVAVAVAVAVATRVEEADETTAKIGTTTENEKESPIGKP